MIFSRCGNQETNYCLLHFIIYPLLCTDLPDEPEVSESMAVNRPFFSFFGLTYFQLSLSSKQYVKFSLDHGIPSIWKDHPSSIIFSV